MRPVGRIESSLRNRSDAPNQGDEGAPDCTITLDPRYATAARDIAAGAELLVLGWGSSEGALRAGVRRVRQGGRKVARAHLHHLNPLPANLGEVLRAYPRVLLPEMNSGQLTRVLRAEYLVDVEGYSRVEGRPLFAAEIENAILERLS